MHINDGQDASGKGYQLAISICDDLCQNQESRVMFWRFGFHNSSAIEGIIDKDASKIEDLMGEEELIQEVKGQNQKVISL